MSGRTGEARYAGSVATVLPAADSSRDYRLAVWPAQLRVPASPGLPTRVTHRLPARLVHVLNTRHVAAPRWGLGPARAFHGTTFNVPLLRDVTSIATFHDTAFLHVPDTFPLGVAAGYDKYIRRFGPRIDHIVTHSHAIRTDLLSAYDLLPERVTVIYPPVVAATGLPHWANATDVAGDRRPTAPWSDIELPDRFLLYVGTIGPRKNTTRLIRALHTVKDAIPHSLVIAGNMNHRPDYAQSVVREVSRHGLEDRVRFLAFVPDTWLPSLFSRCAAFVFPSLYEGFGYPVIEAMSFGKPVVISNRASLPEVGGRLAIQVDPNSESAIGEGMMRALSEEHQSTVLARARRDWAARFNQDAFASSMLDLYGRIGIK
jgi:glycosyltransferase involved in cell wall biosynthesis